MRRIFGFAVVFLLMWQFAAAQSVIDANVGFGTATNSALGGGVDTFGTGLPCTVGSSTSCYPTNSMGGLFLGVGANMMLWKHFGVGMEAQMQPGQHDTAGLKERTMFYDFNGIWQPVSVKRAALQLVGGIGGANTKFYYSSSFCGAVVGCSTQNQYLQSVNHFAVHAAVGVQVYLTEKVFLRPQVDFRYITSYTEQWGKSTVPSYMVWLGYSFGDRQ